MSTANQKFGDSQAGRIVAAIQTRIERKFKSNAYVQTTWGTVTEVSDDMKSASAYLYSDSSYTSEAFRIPDTKYATVGDIVKVAIDYSTGERWIEEIWFSSAYKTIAIDPASGAILVGDGTVPPVPLAVGSLGVVAVKEDNIVRLAAASAIDFTHGLDVVNAGGGRATVAIDESELSIAYASITGAPIWKPVMANNPSIITTDGTAVYVPLVTIEGEAIMGATY